MNFFYLLFASNGNIMLKQQRLQTLKSSYFIILSAFLSLTDPLLIHGHKGFPPSYSFKRRLSALCPSPTTCFNREHIKLMLSECVFDLQVTFRVEGGREEGREAGMEEGEERGGIYGEKEGVRKEWRVM